MSKKSNKKQKIIHVPKAKNVALETSKREIVKCIDKIQKASLEGSTSCYLLGSSNGYITQQTEKQLLEAGYDLIKMFYDITHNYFLIAIWDDTATGKLIIRD